jgi:membrane peptidoglycan carboxypeptidase
MARWAVIGGLVFLAIFLEVRTASLEAHRFPFLARGLLFTLESGPNPRPYFPDRGPYDLRLGYARLPSFLGRLRASGYSIDSQARLSPGLQQVAGLGLFPIYREKTQAGLHVVDRDGRPLFSVRDPERTYERFEAVPPLVVLTLLFIEDRQLLDPRHPHRNPAVEWDRLSKAVGINALSLVGHEGRVIGGSTLATQLEKFRHSPDGRTRSARDKLRQMLSATLRAYRGGTDTLPARRQIVLDYLNSVPLAAAPGRGETYGLGDGLWAWYGVDVVEANRLLADPSAPSKSRARMYKQVLSLILAARRPSYYLVEHRKALDERPARAVARDPDAGSLASDRRQGAHPPGA